MRLPCEGDLSSSGSLLDEPDLEQVRLDDILDRILLLTDDGCDGMEPDRPPSELVGKALKDLTIHDIKPLSIDSEHFEDLGDPGKRLDILPDRRIIADDLHEPVGDPRGAAALLGNDGEDLGVPHLAAENPERSGHDLRKVPDLVEIELQDVSETVSQRA